MVGLSIKYHPDGNIVFTYYTSGDFPIIIGNIDLDGNLDKTTGMALNQPFLQVGSDGSILMLSFRKFEQDGNSSIGNILGKTNTDGSMDNCPQFNACLSLYDFELTYQPVIWHAMPSDTMDRLNMKMREISTSSQDYCVTPIPPTPFFLLPDTICQNQCLSPDSLNNSLAHAVNWTIHRDSVLYETEDLTFNYCFNIPGTYQIEQEIWLLGCSEFFTHELVVLSDSLGDLLGDDRVVCEDSVVTLIPNAIRPIKSFEWSDGSSTSSLKVSESGTYVTKVTDGFCVAIDRVAITFFEDLFTDITLELPLDTAVCEAFLPFSLTPKSDFLNEFFINNETNAQSVFEIIQPGNYQIRTNIEGCDFVENFNLSLVPCEVDVYIPSSFSPNNDGINDLLEPLGNDFIGKQMTIYDRWGGKLFETKNPPFSWDGDRAEEGVYVLTFSYFNLRNNKEELISADVLVVR